MEDDIVLEDHEKMFLEMDRIDEYRRRFPPPYTPLEMETCNKEQFREMSNYLRQSNGRLPADPSELDRKWENFKRYREREIEEREGAAKLYEKFGLPMPMPPNSYSNRSVYDWGPVEVDGAIQWVVTPRVEDPSHAEVTTIIMEKVPEEKKKQKAQVHLTGNHLKKRKIDPKTKRVVNAMGRELKTMAFYLRKFARSQKKCNKMLRSLKLSEESEASLTDGHDGNELAI